MQVNSFPIYRKHSVCHERYLRIFAGQNEFYLLTKKEQILADFDHFGVVEKPESQLFNDPKIIKRH